MVFRIIIRQPLQRPNIQRRYTLFPFSRGNNKWKPMFQKQVHKPHYQLFKQKPTTIDLLVFPCSAVSLTIIGWKWATRPAYKWKMEDDAQPVTNMEGY